VAAHEVRPAYLELVQTGPETWDALLKVPARSGLRLSLHDSLPDECEVTVPRSRYDAGNAFLDRWSFSCPGGLAGRRVGIEGFTGAMTDGLVRIERLDGSSQVARVTVSEPTVVVTASQEWTAVAGTYVGLGIEHILLGTDHLLFVLTLLMLVRGWRRVLGTVTAFTIAHSISLAAAVLGFVHVPGPPVEAVVALSIVFVASEIVHGRQGRPGLTERKPWLVSFTFGLLHGLSFAGALTNVGLPERDIPLALLFFNVGVEAGQVLFVLSYVGMAAALGRLDVRPPAWGWRAATYAIGGVAAFWMIDRVARFGS